MKLILFFAIIFSQVSTFAATFPGFQKKSLRPYKAKEAIVRKISQDQKEYEIAFIGGAAFYRFPANKMTPELKKILESSRSQQKSLKFVVDIASRELIQIEN